MQKLCRAVLLAALLVPLQAQAGQRDAVCTFTAGLYEAYKHGEPDYLGAQASNTFAPHLLALIRHDQATTASGDSPSLDWDPICACQDYDGLKVERLAIKDVKPDRKVATVALSRGGADVAAVTVVLDVVTWNGRWRVADVHTKRVPSLVGFLEASARTDKAEAEIHH